MALHRVDGRWRSVDVPHDFTLEDVAILPGARPAWAVGSTFALRWRNGHWGDAGSPFGSDVLLNAVEIAGRQDVWVAGTRAVGESDVETFIAHWDGSTWEISPSGTGHPGWLKSLEAVDSDDIWAVGNSIVLHWDGFSWFSWQEVPKGFTGGQLYDVTSVPGSRVLWAVGQQGRKTLTLRYCG